MRAISKALLIATAIYLSVSLLGIKVYGSAIEKSILKNIGCKYGSEVHWEGYAMQFLFLFILGCHVPFVNYAGKEAILILVDEYQRGD